MDKNCIFATCFADLCDCFIFMVFDSRFCILLSSYLSGTHLILCLGIVSASFFVRRPTYSLLAKFCLGQLKSLSSGLFFMKINRKDPHASCYMQSVEV